jgi:DNA-binding response OmpR family regulator
VGGVKFMKLPIVDDELSEKGHSVMCAYDGADGLHLARQFEFHVILLDVMLPKIRKVR